MLILELSNVVQLGVIIKIKKTKHQKIYLKKKKPQLYLTKVCDVKRVHLHKKVKVKQYLKKFGMNYRMVTSGYSVNFDSK